ncbi:MAG: phosphatase PAP2 family protein [Lachnospiraceae bacterium]|nr:phosphatase PAP2 family protein [Lachnospiraceae bacterium]
MKNFVKKYWHGIPILVYLVVYMACFVWVEKRTVDNFTVIHMALDDMIPFVEIFVLPYFCWFAYIAIFVVYFIFFDKEEYTRLFTTLTAGMTLFIIISALWPNMHELRPNLETLGRENVFTRMIGGLYTTDTCTNIVPSIHVYNSIMVQLSIMKSEKLKKHKIVRWGSFVLCVLIVLSTVFIKQHSVFDMITAFALGLIMYFITYKKSFVFLRF